MTEELKSETKKYDLIKNELRELKTTLHSTQRENESHIIEIDDLKNKFEEKNNTIHNLQSLREEIDIDLLRLNTEYDDDVSADDQHILWMWEILKEWDHEKRRAFLRFVWARSHLPPTAKEFKQKFKIQALVGDGPRNHPDKYLPKAHTCFFSINLPLYSNNDKYE